MSHLCYYLLLQSINEILVEVPGSLLEQPLKYICQFCLKRLGEGKLLLSWRAWFELQWTLLSNSNSKLWKSACLWNTRWRWFSINAYMEVINDLCRAFGCIGNNRGIRVFRASMFGGHSLTWANCPIFQTRNRVNFSILAQFVPNWILL